MGSNNIANTHLIHLDPAQLPMTPIVDGFGRGFSLDAAQTSSSNNISLLSPSPSPGAPIHNNPRDHSSNQQLQTFKELEEAVTRGVLDIYKAGNAVHKAYLRNDINVVQEVKKFVEKYAQKVKSSEVPLPSPSLDPYYMYIMLHGYGIVSQLALAAAHSKPSTQNEGTKLELGELVGAACNVKQDAVIQFPSEAPFSGRTFDCRIELPKKGSLASHVYVKKVISAIISRSCESPTDIQEISWELPDEMAVSRMINPVRFPKALYESILNVILQYFRLDEDLLCRGSYDSESCKELRCLQGITDENMR